MFDISFTSLMGALASVSYAVPLHLLKY